MKRILSKLRAVAALPSALLAEKIVFAIERARPEAVPDAYARLRRSGILPLAPQFEAVFGVHDRTKIPAHGPGSAAEPLTERTVDVHMFWAYGALRNLEKLCVNSFVSHGYRVSLWTYDLDISAPAGAELKDARAILPESSVFRYENGSYAGFADLFRYAVLCRLGGLWSDTDVVCLSAPTSVFLAPFLVSERTRGAPGVHLNNNLIHVPGPAANDIIDLAFHFARQFPQDRLDWGDCGPRLLTALATAYPKFSYPVLPPDFANPFAWWDCPRVLLKPGTVAPAGAAFLHLYHETWRREGVDANGPFPAGSLMARLADRWL